MAKKEKPVLEQLRAAVTGLNWTSESDYPVTVVDYDRYVELMKKAPLLTYSAEYAKTVLEQQWEASINAGDSDDVTRNGPWY